MKTWYDGEIWNPNDAAYKSVLVVRKLHKSVADKLNANLVEGVDQLKLSQYDMLITQFAFIGFVILMPKKFGIVWTTEETVSVLHFWRLIGYLLGVEEKYNLFSRPYDEVKSLCHVIMDKEMRTAFEGGEEESVQARQMSRGILESIRPYVPLIRWDSYLKYLAHILDSSEKGIPLNFKSRFVYESMKVTLHHLHRSDSIAFVLNICLRKAIQKAHRKRVKIAQKLEKKYADYVV